MTELRITLPDEKMAQIRERATESGSVTPEAYVEGLIEKDLGEEIDEELEALLLERAKGPFIDWTPKHAEELQAQLLGGLKNRSNP